MLFNSSEFIFFFIIVSAGFFLVPTRLKGPVLLASSYFFYMYWNVSYLFLILGSTVVDYVASQRIFRTKSSREKNVWLGASISINLSLLALFKYYNFFVRSMADVLGAQSAAEHFILDVLLPVGISFYTFQTMSYTIDVYKGKLSPEKRFDVFALYVSFFPQLVAGPIERSTNLLPQLRRLLPFRWENFVPGLQLMLWGFFKKTVVADNLALTVDRVYAQPEVFSSFDLALATVFFAFQIYCDFSGYTDIARGVARTYNINLMENFKQPYFALSLQEFWQRWHISLSTWFRDYVYIPLGGNRVSRGMMARNVVLVFLLSGLWHGANWTFVVWGAIHAAYFLVELYVFGPLMGSRLNTGWSGLFSKGFRWLSVFSVVSLAWIFFRSETVSQGFEIVQRILLGTSNGTSEHIDFSSQQVRVGLASLGVLILIDLEMYSSIIRNSISKLGWTFLRPLLCSIALVLIFLLGRFDYQEFIYFQF